MTVIRLARLSGNPELCQGSIVLIITMFKVLKSASSVLRAASLTPVRGIKLLLHTRHSSWDKLSR